MKMRIIYLFLRMPNDLLIFPKYQWKSLRVTDDRSTADQHLVLAQCPLQFEPSPTFIGEVIHQHLRRTSIMFIEFTYTYYGLL